MQSDNKPYKIELSDEAYNDLVNIQNYTFSNYGDQGWKKYENEVLVGFQMIANHPEAGHKRSDIPNNYRAWKIREHIVIYRIDSSIIYVVRVLHGRMNFRWIF